LDGLRKVVRAEWTTSSAASAKSATTEREWGGLAARRLEAELKRAGVTRFARATSRIVDSVALEATSPRASSLTLTRSRHIERGALIRRRDLVYARARDPATAADRDERRRRSGADRGGEGAPRGKRAAALRRGADLRRRDREPADAAALALRPHVGHGN
jgi:hypothetical protein